MFNMAQSDKKSNVTPYNTRASKQKKPNTSTKMPSTPSTPASIKSGKYNKKNRPGDKQTYKEHLSSDDDDEDYTSMSEEEEEDDFIASSDEEEAEANDKLAMLEYRKFLNELFPSNHMKDRVTATAAATAALASENKKFHKKCAPKPLLEPVFAPAPILAPTPRKKTKGAAALKKKIKEAQKEEEEEMSEDLLSSDEDEDEDDDEDYSDEDEDYSDEEDDEDTVMSSFPTKHFNISFIIEPKNTSSSSQATLYDEDEEEEEDEDEYDEDEEEEEEYDTLSRCNPIGKRLSSIKDVSSPASSSPTATPSITDEAAFTKMKGLFENLSAEEQQNPAVKGILDKIKAQEKAHQKKIETQTRQEKKKNTLKFKSLLREKDVMNDLKYFHEKMTVAEQTTALEQIALLKQHSDVTKPYRLSLLDADIPPQYKASAYRKISTLRFMEPGGGEYYKMKNWVDAFMKIPFGQYKNLPISLKDGVEKCHDFMDNAKKILDAAVYGLNDAKLQIMQMVGQWIVNPNAIGTAIAIKGPMGTGKTTLVKEGISKILGRDFAFIALGGATDSSFLEGHSYTYEGSTWGKIVDLLIHCKSMNPVIYFDELDKISDTPKGEEIVGILTHLTDTSQNNQFHDRYFSEINFDLSRCLFIFSYNDESKVNRILLDRMYRIQTKGYDQAQKTTIANNYLLPKILEQIVFNTEDITISEDTMHYIITHHTDKEDGVRTLKRCLEIIYTKLNLYRLMKPGTNLFENDMSIKVAFPMQVTPEIVDKLIKKELESGGWKNMYL
jgi:ATP-dependent Lon protease